MKLKDLVLLAGAYIAGNAVASVYNSKKGEDLEEEMASNKDGGMKILWNNIVNIHKKFFDDIKNSKVEMAILDKDGVKVKFSDLFKEGKEKVQDLTKEGKEKLLEYIEDIKKEIKK